MSYVNPCFVRINNLNVLLKNKEKLNQMEKDFPTHLHGKKPRTYTPRKPKKKV